MIDYLTALFLGFVEGLTEFIPVSSTGHLILLIKGMHFKAPPGDVFEVVIQIGAILAVMVLYRQKIIHTIASLGTEAKSRAFAINVVIGTIPAVIVGGLFHSFIKDLYNPILIGVTLILGAIIILIFEKKFDHPTVESVDDITPKQAFLIGCCQTIAMIPGVSRSGATIMGSLALGLSRVAATEFSFFLAIPVMFLAVGYDLFKNRATLADHNQTGLILAGTLAAFITAIIVIKTVIGFISRHGFAPFAWYRIALGLAVLALFWHA